MSKAPKPQMLTHWQLIQGGPAFAPMCPLPVTPEEVKWFVVIGRDDFLFVNNTNINTTRGVSTRQQVMFDLVV